MCVHYCDWAYSSVWLVCHFLIIVSQHTHQFDLHVIFFHYCESAYPSVWLVCYFLIIVSQHTHLFDLYVIFFHYCESAYPSVWLVCYFLIIVSQHTHLFDLYVIFFITVTQHTLLFDDCLAGLTVKASASGAEDPGFESFFRQDFFQVESYQWLRNWHSSGYPARRLAL